MSDQQQVASPLLKSSTNEISRRMTLHGISHDCGALQSAKQLRELKLAAPVCNLWHTGSWTQDGLQQFTIARPDVQVSLLYV